MRHFENISQAELQILENAISQITLLIAVSDGIINKEEIDWASKLVHIRTYSGDKSLIPFYEQVEANFKIKLNDLIKNSPQDMEACKTFLSEKIANGVQDKFSTSSIIILGEYLFKTPFNMPYW